MFLLRIKTKLKNSYGPFKLTMTAFNNAIYVVCSHACILHVRMDSDTSPAVVIKLDLRKNI